MTEKTWFLLPGPIFTNLSGGRPQGSKCYPQIQQCGWDLVTALGKGLAVRKHSLFPTSSRGSGHGGKLAQWVLLTKTLQWRLNRLPCSQREPVFGIINSFNKERGLHLVTTTQTLSPGHKPHAEHLHAFSNYRTYTTKHNDWKQLSFSLIYKKTTDVENAPEWLIWSKLFTWTCPGFWTPNVLGRLGVEMSGRREVCSFTDPPQHPHRNTHAAHQHPCQPSGIPLPNCLISWIALNPHWFKLMVQMKTPLWEQRAAWCGFIWEDVCTGGRGGRNKGLKVGQRGALAFLLPSKPHSPPPHPQAGGRGE